MVAKRAVPDDHHISRFVPYNRQFRHPDTDEFLGVAPSACAMREQDNGGLSVNWIEFFGPYDVGAKAAAAVAFRESLPSKKLPNKAAFVYANVARLRATTEGAGKQIRVVHAPVPGNDGHAEIRHFDDDDLGLLEMIASDVFCDPDLVADMNLPSK